MYDMPFVMYYASAYAIFEPSAIVSILPSDYVLVEFLIEDEPFVAFYDLSQNWFRPPRKRSLRKPYRSVVQMYVY